MIFFYSFYEPLFLPNCHLKRPLSLERKMYKYTKKVWQLKHLFYNMKKILPLLPKPVNKTLYYLHNTNHYLYKRKMNKTHTCTTAYSIIQSTCIESPSSLTSVSLSKSRIRCPWFHITCFMPFISSWVCLNVVISLVRKIRTLFILCMYNNSGLFSWLPYIEIVHTCSINDLSFIF